MTGALVARVVLSVAFVLLVVTGMTIHAFTEARHGGSRPATGRARRGLAGPRPWYVAAALVFLSVVVITILSGGAS